MAPERVTIRMSTTMDPALTDSVKNPRGEKLRLLVGVEDNATEVKNAIEGIEGAEASDIGLEMLRVRIKDEYLNILSSFDRVNHIELERDAEPLAGNL